MIFFPGLPEPSHARHFPRACISINRLRRRVSDFEGHDWIMDSGAFSELSTYGKYRHPVEQYAAEIERWGRCGHLLAAVTQDYMCEPFMLQRTGLSIEEHQSLTLDRYRQLLALTTRYIMPVLQGYDPSDYLRHLRMYGSLLRPGMWVGVGSVCKRNTHPQTIGAILSAIKLQRPDLRLHGFGVKLTALRSPYVRSLLYSADSMAWCYSAWRQGRNHNDWREAARFVAKIKASVDCSSDMAA